MIRDMEVLVLAIEDEDIRKYMEEARNCYNVQSYRACIILSTIAAMHDLRNKIKNLASSIPEVRELDIEVERRIQEETNYENYMVEQAASLAILAASETESIKSYMGLRNRCAHPNEYIATAEEARMVFTGFYDNILSQPSLLGPAYIRVIMQRLINDNLFPEQKVKTVNTIVEEEYKKLHPKAIMPLASKLISLLENSSSHEEIEVRNATFFLAGLLAVQDREEKVELIARKLGRLLETNSSFNNILVMCGFFPSIVKFLNQTDKKRFISHLKLIIDSNMNLGIVQIIHMLFTEEVFNDSETTEIIKEFTEQISNSVKVISGNTDRSSITEIGKWISIVKKLNILDTDLTFFNTLINLINDNDYNVVNEAIKLLKNLEKDFLDRVNSQQINEIIITIIKQAYGPGRGADEARTLVKNNFKDISELMKHFIEYITINSNNYLAYIDRTVIGGEEEILTFIETSFQFEEMNMMIEHMVENTEVKERKKDEELEYLRKILLERNLPEWESAIEKINAYFEK